MKQLIPTFLLGAIVGAIGMYLVTQPAGPEAAAEVPGGAEPEESARTGAAPAVTRVERDSAGGPAVSKLPRPEGERKKAKAVVKTSRQFDMQDYRKRMLEQEKERSAKRVNAKLAALVERLGLNAAQEARVRALLEKQEAGRGNFARLLKLAGEAGEGREIKGGEALPIVADVTGKGQAGDSSFEEEMRAVLEGDQLAAYDEYLQEQRANQVEIQANRQLTQLQTMLDLTAEQKDLAFEAFARIAEEEQANPWVGSPNMEVFQRQRQKRQEAMADILTPEQMELYESTMGRKGITINAVGDGAGVIQTETRVLEVAPEGGQD